MAELSRIEWDEAGARHAARWQSEAGVPPPRRVAVADDALTADQAIRLVSEGSALLWQGDFHNARQLLQAMARRIDRKAGRKRGKPAPAAPEALPGHEFNLHRQSQSHRARLLGMLLIPFDANFRIPLRRAPAVELAAREAGVQGGEAFLVSLRELLGWIGAHEWRKKGVAIAALGGASIHPHYGVFSPVRGEYLELAAKAPLPAALSQDSRAFDIGTGTGVLAALLARRGVAQVVATDTDPRALDCARENLARLGLSGRVELLQADLFPPGRAALLICNPPWLPARPAAPIERAVYDQDSRMLRGFLDGLRGHLSEGGEGWLVMSDLAEHLGLRGKDQLAQWIEAAGLQVRGRLEAKPVHARAADASDPLHAARSRELTSLWRLGPAD